MPGEAFGIDPNKLMVRASYVDFSGSDALKSCEGLDLSLSPSEEFFQPWASKIEESIQVLETWLARQIPSGNSTS